MSRHQAARAVRRIALTVGCAAVLAAASSAAAETQSGASNDKGAAPGEPAGKTGAASANLAKATFAGGCFWCMEPPFEAIEGVKSVTSGYTGGVKKDPTYEEVSAGGTGHTESVEIVYDPSKVSYEKLLDVFWHNIDPLTKNAQFCDHGSQYRSAIFYHDETQHRLAEESKQRIESSKKLPGPIVTEIVPASTFYSAEEYHQDYAKKNPVRYNYYRYSCGRDARLAQVWGDAAASH